MVLFESACQRFLYLKKKLPGFRLRISLRQLEHLRQRVLSPSCLLHIYSMPAIGLPSQPVLNTAVSAIDIICLLSFKQLFCFCYHTLAAGNISFL